MSNTFSIKTHIVLALLLIHGLFFLTSSVSQAAFDRAISSEFLHADGSLVVPKEEQPDAKFVSTVHDDHDARSAPTGDIWVDPATRTVENSLIRIKWHSTASTGIDLVRELYYKPYSNTYNLLGYPGDATGSSLAFHATLQNDTVIAYPVTGSNTNWTWLASVSEHTVTIYATSVSMDGIPVSSEYVISADSPVIRVTRTFGFASRAIGRSRLTTYWVTGYPRSQFYRFAYPTVDGNVSLVQSSCEQGCVPGNWDQTWIDLEAPGWNVGLGLINRPGNPQSAPWLDRQGGSSQSFISAAVPSGPGGFATDLTVSYFIVPHLGDYHALQSMNGSISGRVVVGPDQGLAETTIITSDPLYSTTTDANGYYTLADVISGTYVITPVKDGYVFTPPSLPVQVPPDATGQNFIATLQTYSISGRVTDGDGVALQGVIITDGAGHTATTNGSDNYTLAGLEAGSYTLTPTKDGYIFTPPSRTTEVLGETPLTQIPPPPGLISWWPADGNADDIVGGNNGTLHNGATFAPGMVGQGFHLNGTGAYVLVPDSPSLNLQQFTIDAWVRFDAFYGGSCLGNHIVNKGHDRVPGFYGFVVQDTGGCSTPTGDHRLTMLLRSLDASELKVWGQTNLSAGVFYHLAGTWDGITAKVYVNGVFDGQASRYSGLTLGNTSPLLIGKMDNISYPYYVNGFIDELDIFNRALSESEIQAIYAAGSAGKVPPGATYEISGNVVDEQDTGIAEVMISLPAGESVPTDGNGAYAISGLTAGTYTLTPSKDGYTFSPASRTVTVPPDATGQDFVGTPAAVSIDTVEITQGIQCLNDADCFGTAHTAWCTTADCTNVVPLVVNKPTFVRLYVRSEQEGTPVTALLKGYYQNGQDLPGSPLLSPLVISAHVDGGDRGNAGDSISFQLPAAWTLQDNVTVEPHLYLAGGGSPVDSRQLALAFSDRNAMPVFSWRFRFPGVVAATQAEAEAAARFAAQVYPISRETIDLRDQGEFPTRSGTWPQLTAALSIACEEAKRNSGYSAARCYGWVPQGVAIESTDWSCHDDQGHPRQCIFYGWTDNGVSVGYIYRPPLTGGAQNLAPQYIMAHEIGHTFPPLGHVAHSATGCTAAQDGEFETYFPNTTGSIKQYGFYHDTSDHVYTPANYFDMMSYCGVNSNHQWISPYTYRHLFDALGSPDLARAASAPATGQPYLVVSGVITPTVTAAISSIYREEYPAGSYDGQGSGPYRLELQDSQGAVLFTRYFDQSSPEWLDPATAPVNFFEIMPFTAGTAKLVVKQDAATLAETSASANAPQVVLVQPPTGPVTGDTLQITWTASDADGDALNYTVEYSSDNGGTWQTLAFDQSETSLTVKTADLPGSSQARVRVLASDGFNTTAAESGLLVVPMKPPRVTIVAPTEGAVLTPGQPVHLSGIAEDREDGLLDGTAVTWTLDGSTTIGTGTQLTLLDPPAGQHRITFTAQDSTGSAASTGVDVLVGLQETTFHVSIAVAAPSVTLVWDHTTAPITGYSVYRSTNPYFTPGSDDAQLMAQITPPGLGGQVAYTDNTAFDSLSTFYAYTVCGAYGGDTCAMQSQSTGVLNFALVPGASAAGNDRPQIVVRP